MWARGALEWKNTKTFWISGNFTEFEILLLCSRISKVLLFYESPRQVEERYIVYILRLTANSQSDFIEKLLKELTCKHKFVIKNQHLKC